MPKFEDGMQTLTTPNQYQFTATDIKDLGASEYTLVSIVCDVSGSVYSFRDALEECTKTVLDSCAQSPRSEHLLLRLCAFSDGLEEIHGFKELKNLQRSDYDGVLRIHGCTALFEAGFEAVDATLRYGKSLADKGFGINAIIFIITDGRDNRSLRQPDDLGKLLAASRSNEELESLVTVLVGVTGDQKVSHALDHFKRAAGLDHYLDLGGASRDRLAALAGFIAKSISLTSTVLGSGHTAKIIPLKI